jgi:hypothetical protein
LDSIALSLSPGGPHTALQAQELQQNCVHDALEKSKDCTHLEKQNAQSQRQKIGDHIAKLKAEKRKLQQDFLLHWQANIPEKRKKETTDLYAEQILQVEEEIAQGEREVSSLMETPRRTNWTPDSA